MIPNAPSVRAFAHDAGQASAVVSRPCRINKTYKMYVNGAFIRSESGRYDQVQSASSNSHELADPKVVNVPRASRKDVRDAVLAAKNAWHGWDARSAYNRGQILYRLAEMMESRSDELSAALHRAGSVADAGEAAREVSAAIDRVVYYAGFCDKWQSLLSSVNPVSGPHFNVSVPESLGPVGIVAPTEPSLLGLVSTVAAAIAAGNTCVAVVDCADPRAALVWTECVATSDMPAGVVNMLTGRAKELAGVLSTHREVAGMDVWVGDEALGRAIAADAAGSVKRAFVHDAMTREQWFAESSGQGLGWIERFVEVKTVWHPVGI